MACWGGAVLITAGLWSLWGWPIAAIFFGGLLLLGGGAMAAEMGKKRVL